jgi:flavin reductase (DIM6/NTAB) family NADH-FMN oxidoreductase RutF
VNRDDRASNGAGAGGAAGTAGARRSVVLAHAYRLLNHGPTVLVSSAHGGRRNVMAAAWAMPLDFDPPKVAVVIDKSTFTRELVEASGEFVLGLPCRDLADATFGVGNCSGRELAAGGSDKFERFGLGTFAGSVVGAPLVAGCVAWLECRVLREPHIEAAHDLFLGQVLAAQAGARVFREGRWHFDDAPAALRTLHHVAGGAFLLPGERVQGRMPPPRGEPDGAPS